jgi:hypothetical protein
VETVEAFCAAHKESVDTVLYEWPASKFEALNNAFHKRQLADSLDQKRSLEIASLYANGNFESSEKMEEAIMSIGSAYGRSIAALYGAIDKDDIQSEQAGEVDIDMSDPFFAAMKVAEL